MKLIYLLLFFLSFIGNLSAQSNNHRSGITIYYEVNDTTFPPSWKIEPVFAIGKSLDTSEIKRSHINICKALNKYPKPILLFNLKQIYVLNSLNFFGQNYGGTNSSNVVYLCNKGDSMGYSDFYIEQTFHHEFSSILYHNFESNMKQDEWEALNLMEYGNGGIQALRDSSTSLNFDSLLHKKGFLYQYATSDFENDFNSFAENLFHPSSSFYEKIKQYPILAKKLELTINFYSSLDKEFTREYFISLADPDLNSKK